MCTVLQNSSKNSILLLKIWSPIQKKLDTFQRQTFEGVSLCRCKECGLYVLEDREKLIKGKGSLQGLHSVRGERFVTGGIPKELKASCV